MTRITLKKLLAEANAVIETVSGREAVSLAQKGDAILVDIRETVERTQHGVIPMAIHAPRGFLEFIADPAAAMHKPELMAAKRLVLFCASGGRSTLAAKTMRDMGYPSVSHIAGGFSAWREAGGEIEPAPTTASAQIRAATDADQPAVIAVLEAAYAPYKEHMSVLTPSHEDIEREVADFKTWVVEEQGKIVGAMVLHPMPDHFTVLDLGVHPEAQHKGYSRLLLNTAEAEARKSKIAELLSITHKFHHDAHSFFEKLGWVALPINNQASIIFKMQKTISDAP